MLCFSTTLLLAASSLALVSAGDGSQTITTCLFDGVHRLSCDFGVISVQTALYGRADRETCVEGKQEASYTECSTPGALDVMKSRCDGRTVCELNANVFNPSDSCTGRKYLQTQYNCLLANHLITCEHSVAHLHCDEGLVIYVYTADYGRRDKTTCIYERPASQTQNDNCINPTSKVAQSCNGKNTCNIKAINSVFGDPCVGTYKYLELAYACEYHDQPL